MVEIKYFCEILAKLKCEHKSLYISELHVRILSCLPFRERRCWGVAPPHEAYKLDYPPLWHFWARQYPPTTVPCSSSCPWVLYGAGCPQGQHSNSTNSRKWPVPEPCLCPWQAFHFSARKFQLLRYLLHWAGQQLQGYRGDQRWARHRSFPPVSSPSSTTSLLTLQIRPWVPGLLHAQHIWYFWSDQHG